MKRSLDRILVSHAGSLPRPEVLIQAYRDAVPEEALATELRKAVAGVVDQQIAAGVDVVNDGEFGKPSTDEVDFGAWATYLYSRLGGYELRDTPNVSELVKRVFGGSKDRLDFASFYAAGLDVNTSAIEYEGQALVERDIANLKAAIEGKPIEEAFISAAFTGVQFDDSEFYSSKEEQAIAIAEAIREEYKAIVDAGFNVQIDDPLLVNEYELQYSLSADLAAYRKWAARHIELLNHALHGIPEDKVRYHLCWGSWVGPHSTDLPLSDVIDLLPEINASQYSFEAANPQHEHEWKVWKEIKLPEGKALIPGVVTHKTNILEHPEVVADRIIRYASVVGRENVIAGTDCGLGGRMHPPLAWAKLEALSEGARLASEQLWP
jgi:5-methyltetrahydropteroyltriglutamate--homocysteine methyltransferase